MRITVLPAVSLQGNSPRRAARADCLGTQTRTRGAAKREFARRTTVSRASVPPPERLARARVAASRASGVSLGTNRRRFGRGCRPAKCRGGRRRSRRSSRGPRAGCRRGMNHCGTLADSSQRGISEKRTPPVVAGDRDVKNALGKSSTGGDTPHFTSARQSPFI